MNLRQALAVAMLSIVVAPTGALADAETDAMIQELEAQKKDATPEMRKLLDQQIEALKSATGMLENVEKSGAKAPVIPLAAAMKPFFTPAKAAAVPAWIPDTAERSAVKNADLKCPKGTRIYADKTSMSCAFPASTPGGVPVLHGIMVLFYESTGKIKSQGVYEKGLLRWSIEYHAAGGRNYVAFYDDVEPKVHRENGLCTRYAAGGTVVVSQAEYKSGVLNGWQKLWENDGTPIVATRYENGKAVEEVLPNGTKIAKP